MYQAIARLSLTRDTSDPTPGPDPGPNGCIHLVLTQQTIDEPDVTLVLPDDGSACFRALAGFIAEADAYRDRAIDDLHDEDPS